MFDRNLKTGYFVLEGLNALAATYYSYTLFFYMQQEFGFSKAANLGLSALGGFVYMFAAWYGGNYSQRRGYFSALRIGFMIMALSLVAGFFWRNVVGQIVVM